MKMPSYRTNVGRTQDPDTRTAHGDFPEKVRTVETRPDHLHAQQSMGDIDEGVSFVHDLYQPPVLEDDPFEATRLL